MNQVVKQKHLRKPLKLKALKQRRDLNHHKNERQTHAVASQRVIYITYS